MDNVVQANELKSLFQDKLRSLRKLRDLNQTQLAEKIGAHQPYIAALENGDRSPTFETIAKLSEALSVPPWAFITPEKIPA